MVAVIFDLIEIALCSRQLAMALPKSFECSNFCLNSGELLAKQKHARSAKGVLGKTGRGMPINANASEA